MSQMIIRHEVRNHEEWQKIFVASDVIRKMSGEKSFEIFHNSENPNDISILFEWDDPQKAMKFAQMPGLKEAMKAAGVVGDPVVYLHKDDLTA